MLVDELTIQGWPSPRPAADAFIDGWSSSGRDPTPSRRHALDVAREGVQRRAKSHPQRHEWFGPTAGGRSGRRLVAEGCPTGCAAATMPVAPLEHCETDFLVVVILDALGDEDPKRARDGRDTDDRTSVTP